MKDSKNGKLEDIQNSTSVEANVTSMSSFFTSSTPKLSTTVVASSSTSTEYGTTITKLKPVILPNDGYGALASNKRVSNKSDTSPNNDRGGWFAANTMSQQELMYERITREDDDDRQSSSERRGSIFL
jgi:hypothetical protein